MFRKISMVLSILAIGALSVQAATISGVVKEGDSTGAVIASAIVTLTSTGGGRNDNERPLLAPMEYIVSVPLPSEPAR